MLACLNAKDADTTALLGRLIGSALRPGDTLLLTGPVGAGKTHFSRALIQSRQGEMAEDVPSPTFTIVQTYADAAGVEIWHADLYRLTDPDELIELGLDDAMPDAITLIEWPDRMGTPPDGALSLTFVDAADGGRTITLSGDPVRWGRVARLVHATSLLADAGWADAQVDPLTADASARRYLRLTDGDRRAVLMDDPPPGSLAPYQRMTEWLRTREFHAPRILVADPQHGFLLLEDLGDQLLAKVVQDDPRRTEALYAQVTDLLVALSSHAPPDGLLSLDGAELARQVALIDDYADATGGQAGGIPSAIRTLWAELCADAPPVTGLRDFHAENIVLLADGTFGILDFQDAVAVHPAYDLVSLLQDARRDIPPAVEEACVARFVAATGVDDAQFRAAYALMGAQRGLRIMGIFTRLCVQSGKPRYLAFMPRVWAGIMRDAAHPALAPLRAALADLPAPTVEIIERIRARCASPTA